jgi:hypothetical protein
MSTFSGPQRRPRRARLTAPVGPTPLSTRPHEGGGGAAGHDAGSEPFLPATTKPQVVATEHRSARRVGLVRYLRQVMPGPGGDSVRTARPPARASRLLPTRWSTGDLFGVMALPVTPSRPTDRSAAWGR